MIQALRTVLPIQEKIKAKEKKYICLDISEEAGTQPKVRYICSNMDFKSVKLK